MKKSDLTWLIREVIFNENEAESVYQNSLKDSYWQEISKQYPDYNNHEAKPAALWIYRQMKKKYPDANWNEIGVAVYTKIFDGIT